MPKQLTSHSSVAIAGYARRIIQLPGQLPSIARELVLATVFLAVVVGPFNALLTSFASAQLAFAHNMEFKNQVLHLIFRKVASEKIGSR